MSSRLATASSRARSIILRTRSATHTPECIGTAKPVQADAHGVLCRSPTPTRRGRAKYATRVGSGANPPHRSNPHDLRHVSRVGHLHRKREGTPILAVHPRLRSA